MTALASRLRALPRLGVGLSTEFGSADAGGLDPLAFAAAHPGLVDFLEIGVDLERGLDAASRRWVDAGRAVTWHFLDVNLEDPEDLDEAWLRDTAVGARSTGAAWLCGDAGLWHIGPRDRGHGTLLPPIHCETSARRMAASVRRLREASGLEVLPENPPSHVFVGDLHPLAYYARVTALADCGLLLDVSHLAIAQRALGLSPLFGLDDFPLDRVVEVHVAGSSDFACGGRVLLDDDHGPRVVDDVWQILAYVVPRLTALRAVTVECERNPPDVAAALMTKVRSAVADAPGFRFDVGPVRSLTAPTHPNDAIDPPALQRTLFRMLLDPTFAATVRADPAAPAPLRALDPELLSADPGDRRRDQLLGNVASELLHVVRHDPRGLHTFLQSPHFHQAIASARPLVPALGRHLDAVVADPIGRALLSLDRALAEARRRPEEPAPSDPRRVSLSTAAQVLTLPAGTLACAEAMRAGVAAPPLGEHTEPLLIVAGPAPAQGLRPLEVEPLGAGLATLLLACPLDEDGLRRFAAAHELTGEELAAQVTALRHGGILSGGEACRCGP